MAFLRTKCEDKSITDAEYEELTRLTDQAEELHADRMAALVELAKCRGVSLVVLMDQLGIHFPCFPRIDQTIAAASVKHIPE